MKFYIFAIFAALIVVVTQVMAQNGDGDGLVINGDGLQFENDDNSLNIDDQGFRTGDDDSRIVFGEDGLKIVDEDSDLEDEIDSSAFSNSMTLAMSAFTITLSCYLLM